MALTKQDHEVIGSYLEIGAAAQELDRALTPILADSEASAAQMRVALTSADVLRRGFQSQVQKSLQRIDKVFDGHADQRSWWGDVLVRVRSGADSVLDSWSTLGTATKLRDAILEIADRLDEIVFQCQSLTLTPRLGQILDNVRVGQSVSLESLVGKEFPRSPERRERLLNELADQDGVLDCGYFDPNRGLLYRVAFPRATQRWSIVRLIGVFVIGSGAIFAACHIEPGTDWPFQPAMWLDLLTKCWFLLGGAGLHLLIQGVNVARRSKTPLSRPWNDWVLWLHAHEVQSAAGVAAHFIGFFVLVFTMPDMTWQTAFFAGYSFDSLLDVLLDRFEQLASAKSKDIATQLAPSLVVKPAEG
jgi:hypothetical protein